MDSNILTDLHQLLAEHGVAARWNGINLLVLTSRVKCEQQIDLVGFVDSAELSLRVPKRAFPAEFPKSGQKITRVQRLFLHKSCLEKGSEPILPWRAVGGSRKAEDLTSPQKPTNFIIPTYGSPARSPFVSFVSFVSFCKKTCPCGPRTTVFLSSHCVFASFARDLLFKPLTRESPARAMLEKPYSLRSSATSCSNFSFFKQEHAEKYAELEELLRESFRSDTHAFAQAGGPPTLLYGHAPAFAGIFSPGTPTSSLAGEWMDIAMSMMAFSEEVPFSLLPQADEDVGAPGGLFQSAIRNPQSAIRNPQSPLPSRLTADKSNRESLQAAV